MAWWREIKRTIGVDKRGLDTVYKLRGGISGYAQRGNDVVLSARILDILNCSMYRETYLDLLWRQCKVIERLLVWEIHLCLRLCLSQVESIAETSFCGRKWVLNLDLSLYSTKYNRNLWLRFGCRHLLKRLRSPSPDRSRHRPVRASKPHVIQPSKDIHDINISSYKLHEHDPLKVMFLFHHN